jgi:glucokinase
MIVVAGGRPCPCGQRGCLERYASANAVGERLIEAISGGERSILGERLARGQAIEAEDVVAAARDDELAARIWDEACHYLALACVNLQHVLNPKRIVFTGGMVGAGEKLFACVRMHFERLYWNVARDCPELVPAALGSNAGIIGAAALAKFDEA